MTVEISFSEVLQFTALAWSDDVGECYQSFHSAHFTERLAASGCEVPVFVQDNHSKSQKGVLRGLHYQLMQPQGKLLHVVAGSIFDVVVDVRRNSPTFGRWSGLTMSAQNRLLRWVPAGFAHGFLVTSDNAELLYKTTDYWAPDHERCLLWDDPALGIAWPIAGPYTLSAKDQAGKLLADAEVFA